ncbi:peptidase [Thioflexithrix psekupsensis]|uniref:Peptidase n=2 Tax=Thioflexithrix psekupsensis TaxID=1570016 RepID=A0A251XDK4_9GAMM|nr:peptidase [Thioflexithrix psekupsensis]
MLWKRMVLMSLVLFIFGCATSPLGRSQFAFLPAEQMDIMGEEAFLNLKQEMRLTKSASLSNYVTCVSGAIIDVSQSSIPHWEIAVFEEPTANAFALPGGKIGVHTGLFQVAKTPHQMATVIGHEIAHVLSNHGNERVSQQFAVEQGLALVQALANVQTETGQLLMGLLGVGAQLGILMPYSRVQESEADILGLHLMARAGFDPRESVALWQNMASSGGGDAPEFLSTHPSHQTRISELQNAIPYAMQLYEQAQRSGRRPNCRMS